MSTFIRITVNNRARYPYAFTYEGRHFQLHQFGKGWELIEYKDDNQYPVVARWSSRKNHERMVGEALAIVIAAVRKETQ